METELLAVQGGSLIRQLRAKSEFLAHMSHDLRAPPLECITSGIGFSEIIKNQKSARGSERLSAYMPSIFLSTGPFAGG